MCCLATVLCPCVVSEFNDNTWSRTKKQDVVNLIVHSERAYRPGDT